MSNQVNIVPTIFVNARSGDQTYGYRAYDDQAMTYGNTLKDIPKDDMKFLKAVIAEGVDDTLSDMLNFVRMTKKGICIDGSEYPYEKIKDIISY